MERLDPTRAAHLRELAQRAVDATKAFLSFPPIPTDDSIRKANRCEEFGASPSPCMECAGCKRRASAFDAAYVQGRELRRLMDEHNEARKAFADEATADRILSLLDATSEGAQNGDPLCGDCGFTRDHFVHAEHPHPWDRERADKLGLSLHEFQSAALAPHVPDGGE